MGTIDDAYSTGFEDGIKAANQKENEIPVTRYDNCGNYSASWRCPKCYELATSTYNNYSYCQYCGQKLIWDFVGRDK